VQDVSLSVKRGEIFTLIGPSGSGKTTLLRIIDLLDFPTEGTLLIDGVPAPEKESERTSLRRKMAMVFQKPVIFNVSVEENVAYGLAFRGVPDQEIRKKTDEALALVGLEGYGGRLATTLSGGEAQRLAIARAMVTDPRGLILDEPTANLDPISIEKIENLITEINRSRKTTVIMATHDMAQGQRLASRIAVIVDGRIAQNGDPEEVFYRPASRAVARFVGMENILPGTVTVHEKGLAVIDLGGGFTIEAVTTAQAGQRVLVCIRAEEIVIQTGDETRSSARNRWHGTVRAFSAEGPIIRLKAAVDTHELLIAITRRSCSELGLKEGSHVIMSLKASAVHVIWEGRQK
jgi:tungstate transport system ATP-binding protein